MEQLIIQPQKGFGEVKFGMTRDQVTAILGKPDSEATESYADETEECDYEYEALGVQLSFASDEDFRLGSITYYSQSTLVFGQNLVGVSNAEFLERVADMDISDLRLEDDFDDMGMQDYFADSVGLSFWSNDGHIESITSFPAYDEKEQPIWPE